MGASDLCGDHLSRLVFWGAEARSRVTSDAWETWRPCQERSSCRPCWSRAGRRPFTQLHRQEELGSGSGTAQSRDTEEEDVPTETPQDRAALGVWEARSPQDSTGVGEGTASTQMAATIPTEDCTQGVAPVQPL